MLQTLATTPLSQAEPRAPVRVAGETTLLDVVLKMREADQGAVLIEDEGGRLIGILTERDLVRISSTAPDRSWLQEPVSKHMVAGPATVHATTSLASVFHLMSKGSFRRLPVVDADGHAIGIISVRDMLTYVAESFPEELANLPSDPRHEATARWGG